MESLSNILNYWWILAILIAVCIFYKILGIRFIPNNKVGIVEKLIGKGKKDGSIIALNGETGFRADVLRAGIHVLPWPWFKLHKVSLITIPQGKMAYVFARNGEPLGQGQIAGKIVECNNFENVREFLQNGGQKGPQRAILREGTYSINLAQFIVIAEDDTYYMPLGIPGEEEQIEDMSRLISSRDGFNPVIVSDKDDEIAIVTVQDGPSLPKGELLARSVEGHNSYQDIEAFLANGGCKGRQEDVLLDGTYYINRLFATIEMDKKREIPIGQVGVVNCFIGEQGKDISGDKYSHGDLVEKGKKGIWNEVLLPNKYAWNKYAGTIYLVPTINFVLNWSSERNTDFAYDQKLQEITLITKDAFQPSLPLSVVIHINYKDAPRVIQRFGDIKTLVEQTVDPMVGAYFKNIGQTKTLLELIQERGKIQQQAKDEMAEKFKQYDLNLEDVLIGTPQSNESDEGKDKKNCVKEIYKQLQDRQLAKEEGTTFEAQKISEDKKKELEEAKTLAAMQSEITASKIKIEIKQNEGIAKVKEAEQKAKEVEINAKADSTKMKIDTEAKAEKTRIEAEANAKKVTIEAKAEADRVNMEAEAQANSIEKKGIANADATARQGIADAIAIQEKIRSLGSENYTATIIAQELKEAIGSYSGDMVPRIMIGANKDGETNAISQILTLLGLKAMSPEFAEMINGNTEQKEASEEIQEISQKIYDEVLKKATSNKEEQTQETASIEETVPAKEL